LSYGHLAKVYLDVLVDDEAHKEWLEANEDEHLRAIRIQAHENVRLLKASVEAKRVN
jgi:hypothetical protein